MQNDVSEGISAEESSILAVIAQRPVAESEELLDRLKSEPAKRLGQILSNPQKSEVDVSDQIRKAAKIFSDWGRRIRKSD